MNWILDTYSNVYQTAMLQPQVYRQDVATAKVPVGAKASKLFGLLKRR